MALGRMIESSQRALADCSSSAPQVGGYIAAQRMRATMLKAELAGYRTELDAVAAEIIEIETALRGEARKRRARLSMAVPRAAATLQRPVPRLGFIAATLAGLALLVITATPVADAFGVIPTLFAHNEDVIEVDVRSLNLAPAPPPWAPTPTVQAPAVLCWQSEKPDTPPETVAERLVFAAQCMGE